MYSFIAHHSFPFFLSGDSDMKLLTSGTISNSASSLDIVLTAYTGYRGLIFVLTGLRPATDNAALWLRFSTDGGSTFATTSYAYAGAHTLETASDYAERHVSTSASAIVLANNVGNVANEHANVVVELMKQTDTALYPTAIWRGSAIDGSGQVQGVNASGTRKAAQDTDAVRFLWSSGNFASSNPGLYAVYGLL